MKIKISRHQIYILLLTLFLLLFVLLFSFGVLIPNGKEYRVKRTEMKKALHTYQKYKSFHDETLQKLKDLQSKNRATITAYERIFSPARFQQKHKAQFVSLKITEVNRTKDYEGFSVYKITTTSHINSPKNFYDFLDTLNKDDWIIGVNFPIEFTRDANMIRSSFTMRVYANNRDKNATDSASVAK